MLLKLKVLCTSLLRTKILIYNRISRTKYTRCRTYVAKEISDKSEKLV